MIGRASEAAAIARFTEQVPDGPVGLLIEGEAGIGKTTIVLEAIRRAREAGYAVLQVRPAEAEADLSYSALTDLVGGIFDAVSDAPSRTAAAGPRGRAPATRRQVRPPTRERPPARSCPS